MRDNPVFDMQVNPDDRNEINFQAFRLSPKTFDLYRLGYAKFFIFLPNIGAAVYANKMEINFLEHFFKFANCTLVQLYPEDHPLS